MNSPMRCDWGIVFTAGGPNFAGIPHDFVGDACVPKGLIVGRVRNDLIQSRELFAPKGAVLLGRDSCRKANVSRRDAR